MIESLKEFGTWVSEGLTFVFTLVAIYVLYDGYLTVKNIKEAEKNKKD